MPTCGRAQARRTRSIYASHMVRDRFASTLDVGDLDIPEGVMDPFIDYIAEELARLNLGARYAA